MRETLENVVVSITYGEWSDLEKWLAEAPVEELAELEQVLTDQLDNIAWKFGSEAAATSRTAFALAYLKDKQRNKIDKLRRRSR